MKLKNDPLLSRKTIRKYSDKEVSDADLNYILDAAIRTSTTGNMQVYSIIVTRESGMKARLAPAHFNQKMVTEAPVMLTFCADFNRFSKWCRLREAEPGYGNFLSFMTAAIDALLAAQTACIAAESKGMGICYLGTTTYMADKIIEILNLPRGVVPVTAITLGWPAEDTEQVDRLPVAAVVHNERYHDYDEAAIDLYYRGKESRDDSIRFIAENGKKTLAQVFTDVRYKKADNIHFSESFLEVLRKQGFMGQKEG
ncbi:MAG: NADPH-dependent oxidoreductase [Bacteroidetes bacterium]|nr:NADPH-dependent oxidoreductase [Bacteroidota bacterium]